ncbi:MAG: beta-ketoacyl synthase N-terminal-like domain-containing protein [Dokdonella sp.]
MATDLVVTGMGVVSAIGQGKQPFTAALLAGSSAFGVMQRPGRRREDSPVLGAEIAALVVPDSIPKQVLRTASLSATTALTVVQEAWDEADLGQLDPHRVGMIVGGSNVQQRELVNVHDSYRERIAFLRPTYALSFMDSDLCGFCTAHFGIQGLAYTVGGASASGQLAVIQAAQAVSSGQVDACIAVGALMDLSYWECQGFRAIGAMGSDRFAATPELACRPFDRDHDGFIYGECSGALVIESLESSRRRAAKPYAALAGWGLAMDGNRNPDPSLQGETRAIRAALAHSGCAAAAIDYVNPHGTGSIVGDETELGALRECGLGHVHLNATKSLVGHGLSAAGAVEIIATLLQMRAGRLHPTRNLDNPIDPYLRWVDPAGTSHQIENALTLSMGFGGMNTALCWQRCP